MKKMSRQSGLEKARYSVFFHQILRWILLSVGLFYLLFGPLTAAATIAQDIEQCESTPGHQSVTVEGEARNGDTYSLDFGPDFTFVLKPLNNYRGNGGPEGWRIEVLKKGEEENLAKLTPPLHGPNATDIEGWHFRNKGNTGPNQGEINVPQNVRTFFFSPEVTEIMGPHHKRNVGHPTAEELTRVMSFGKGELDILD